MTDPLRFAEDLVLAKEYSLMLFETYDRLRQDAVTRLGLKEESLPKNLMLTRQEVK